jgi:hypothetical protein
MFLPDDIQRELRKINKITQNEVLKKEGDLFIAVNVINQQRRIVNIEVDLLERFSESTNTQVRRNILKG